MKIFKSLFFTAFFAFLFLVVSSSSVQAQQQSQRWVCLNAQRASVHEATISVDGKAKLLPSSNTYVVECISNTDCTSGNAALDQQIFGKNNLQTLANQYGYSFNGSSLASNPLMSDANGNIPTFTWASSTSQSHERKWLALNYYDPLSSLSTGNQGGQQQGTFDFETALNKSDCISLAWDPFGRVFDSKTLQPVNKATVTLLMKRADGSFTMMTPADLVGGSLLNPQVTAEDGGFSFVVPDGTYKLTASQGSFTFPEDLSNINPNYKKIYSDIYPGQTGEEIVQSGGVQHRDIPLKEVVAPLETPVKLMEYFYDLDKLNSVIVITGRASQPFAKVNAYSFKPDPVTQQNVRFRLLTENPVITDRFGNFTLKISEHDFAPTESFGEITLDKTDLTQPNLTGKVIEWLLGLIGKQVNAQTLIASSNTFEPILNNLEGYAYDSSGKPLANSTVSIILNFSNKPSYQTKTDETGYYKISSELLPSMAYHITYTTPTGQVIQTTTSKFISQNTNSITAANVNFNQFKNSNGDTITAPPTVKNTTGTPQQNGNGATAGQNKQLLSNNPLLMLIVVIALLIVIILAIVIVYMKRKKEAEAPPAF